MHTWLLMAYINWQGLLTRDQYREMREEIGSMEEVASMLGVNRTTILRREAGSVKITKEACAALISLWGKTTPKEAS